MQSEPEWHLLDQRYPDGHDGAGNICYTNTYEHADGDKYTNQDGNTDEHTDGDDYSDPCTYAVYP